MDTRPGRRRRRRKKGPSYREESALQEQGYSLVAGLDEVGRGPLAGPIVAAAVVLPSKPSRRWSKLIRDSKQLTPAQRQQALCSIEEVARAKGVGICSAEEIDDLGIVAANLLAMSRALDRFPLLPQFLLLDAVSLPDVDIPQKPIIHGDALCLSIAAASILAKVTRDRIMESEDAVYPKYGFVRHKGYATAEHLRCLRRLGPCPIHRRSFAPVRELDPSR